MKKSKRSVITKYTKVGTTINIYFYIQIYEYITKTVSVAMFRASEGVTEKGRRL